MKKQQRREFIKKIVVAGSAIALTGASEVKANSTVKEMKVPKKKWTGSKEVNVALIGAGGMGNQDLDTCLMHEGVNVVAVCDLYEGRLDQAKEKYGEDIYVHKDYKKILKRKNVDAVIIATSDHWHQQISIDALKAGKHVYCEKPMVHSIKEGEKLIKTWKKSGKVMIIGAQGTSSIGNEKAKELLAEGAIGELNFAEGFWARHSPGGAWQYPIPDDASKDTVDWKRYISNTKKREFDPLRFFRWRNYRDYGTGMSGDLFVHLFSSLHYITNSKGPDQISATGGLRYWKDGREVPDVMIGMFQYPEVKEHPGFNLSLRCNFVDGTSGNTYLRLVGSKGSMNIGWQSIEIKTNNPVAADAFAMAKAGEAEEMIDDKKEMMPPTSTITYRVESGYLGAHYQHFGYWLEAIRHGGSVAQNPEFGFRAAAPALLCNDAYHANEFINWDPVKMELVKK